jgi:tetratricopeptide (TPR) repeat protein
MPQPYILVPPQGSDQADEWMKLGLEAQVAGNLPKAQGYYNQALRLDPRHALATQNLAIVFAQSNLLNEALLTIERAAMFDTAHAVMRMNWALMALEADRVDDAIRIGREALAISACTETRLALAMVYGAAGLSEQALPLYDEILKEHPTHPAAGPNSCFIQTLMSRTPADYSEVVSGQPHTGAPMGDRSPTVNSGWATSQVTSKPLGGHDLGSLVGRMGQSSSPTSTARCPSIRSRTRSRSNFRPSRGPGGGTSTGCRTNRPMR